jgi:homoserine O-acetyltransferase
MGIRYMRTLTQQLPGQSPQQSSTGPSQFVSNQVFHFEQGGSINQLELAYETYGRLNSVQGNAILVHHALSTDSHVAASDQSPAPGWWEGMVGPGKYLDTNRWFIICINNLGSCRGSSGPLSINPLTGRAYGPDFPTVTFVDMARSQKRLTDALGITKLHAVIGCSMGAMLSVTWAAMYPEHARNLVSISSCARVYPANQANRILQREAICADAQWKNGHYHDSGTLEGFRTARKIGLLTYRNAQELNQRFSGKTGRESIESYLQYNADKFVRQFDCNSYLRLLGAMDSYDLELHGRRLLDVLRAVTARVLVIAVDSDVLFPPQQQRELFEAFQGAGVRADYIEHRSGYGHDAFLLEIEDFGAYLKDFVEHGDAAGIESGRQMPRRSRFPRLVVPAGRVLGLNVVNHPHPRC